jgi:hypothetical protein
MNYIKKIYKKYVSNVQKTYSEIIVKSPLTGADVGRGFCSFEIAVQLKK